LKKNIYFGMGMIVFASLGAHSSMAIEIARQLFLTDVKSTVDWRPL
jgi:hypothetical protein